MGQARVHFPILFSFVRPTFPTLSYSWNKATMNALIIAHEVLMSIELTSVTKKKEKKGIKPGKYHRH